MRQELKVERLQEKLLELRVWCCGHVLYMYITRIRL